LKDFFERVDDRCLGRTATGLGWSLVLPPVTVVGHVTEADLERAGELGATVAAGLGEGIF